MTNLNLAIVHAHTWPEVPRGDERLVDELTTYLRGAGHKVDVFTGTRGESRFHAGTEGRNYRLRIPWIRALDGYGLTQIETFGIRALVPLLLHRYDVVHTFTPTAALAAVAAGQPTIYTVLGHPTAETLPERRFQRRALIRAIAWSTEVTSLSSSAAASIQTAFGRRPVVLPPGVSMTRWPPNPAPRSGPPRLLFSGNLSNSDRGLTFLFTAFDRLLARRPDARISLSGPGRATDALRDVGSARDHIEPSIDHSGTGAVEEVAGRYRSAHVTVLPSRDEAFGIAFVESLASGTPVIGCSPGGATDIIDSPSVGRLVPFGEVDALVDAIEECIDLAEDPATPGFCRQRAEAWDWPRIGPRYEALYATVAGRRRPPGAALWDVARVRLGARRERSGAPPST